MVILTPDQRLRVFVSSTLAELAAERVAVREVIERQRLSPVMFELGARPYPPRALYRAYLEQSHIFVGLYFERYGWVAPDMDISGLEDEYALSAGMPRLLYIKEPTPQREPRLQALIDQMTAQAQVRTFATTEQLADLVADDLAHLLSERFTGERDVEAAPTEPSVADRLPVPPTTFVGRDREIEEVTALLRRPDVRMVTLAGAGGIGKSRLSLEIGRAVADDFPDGIHLVALAAVPDADLVMPNIASAVGVRTDERASVERVVAEAVGQQRLLLILDNFEHVVEAGPALGRLLESCPNVHLLVTSRRLLRISAEHEYQVPTLSLPAPDPAARPEEIAQSDAVELFVERATAVRPDFRLTEKDAPTVGEIVRRLDGVPLAIELAAARSRLLPPAALLARLERTVDVLAGGLADLPERQQSLRATLDWSATLLDPSERRLLARLSTFASGWTLEAAEAICAADDEERSEILDHLAGLADNSLVKVQLRDDAPVRFRMLQPVREYARELLTEQGEADEVDARHLAYYVDIVEQAGAALAGAEQGVWLDRLEEDVGNIGAAAVRAARGGQAALLADMGWHLWIWLWLNYHVAEARHWLDPLLDRADELPLLQRARLHWVAGSLRYEGGWFDEAWPLVTTALEEFSAIGDDHGRGLALTIAGSIKRHHGDREGAREYLAEATQILRRHGDQFSAALAGGSLAMHWVPGDVATAEPMLEEALADAKAIGNQAMVSQLWLFCSFAAVSRGDAEQAGELLRRIVVTSGGRRSDELLAYGFEGLGGLSLLAGDAARAATLMGAAAGLRRRGGMSVWPGMRSIVDGLIDGTRQAMGDEEFEIAWAAGEALSRDDARSFALEQGAPATSGTMALE